MPEYEDRWEWTDNERAEWISIERKEWVPRVVEGFMFETKDKTRYFVTKDADRL